MDLVHNGYCLPILQSLMVIRAYRDLVVILVRESAGGAVYLAFRVGQVLVDLADGQASVASAVGAE